MALTFSEDPLLATTVECRVLAAMLIRIGGLPYARAEQLDDTVLSQAIARFYELERLAESKAAALLDVLPDAIRDTYGQVEKQRALLAIKRNIYNGRRVSDKDLTAAESEMSTVMRENLEAWRALRHEIDSLSVRTADDLSAWLESKRKALQEIIRIPTFRKGLLASSPSFTRALQRYLAWDGKRIDKSLRNTEIVLLSYLFRTTHKTSPLSMLTTVSLALFDDNANATALPHFRSSELHVSVQPNLGILARLRHIVTRHASNYPGLFLSLKAGARLRDWRVEYRRRIEKLIDISGPVHATATEYTFSISLNSALESLFHNFVKSRRLSVAEVRRLLMSEHDLSNDEATHFIDRLVENGLLVVDGLEWSVLEEDAWSSFANILARADDCALNKIVEMGNKICKQAAEYGLADIARRQEIIFSLQPELDEAFRSIDSPSMAPRPLFYEDASLSSVPLRLSRAAWETHLSDLAELHRALLLFDPLLVSKLTLASLFKKRFGNGGCCEDLVEFAGYFDEVFYRAFSARMEDIDESNPFKKRTLNSMKIPGALAIEDAQAAFLAELAASVRNSIVHGGAQQEEIEISHASLARLALLAPRIHEFASNSFFFQYFEADGQKRIVLNHVYGGTGCAYGRFGQLFAANKSDELQGRLESHIRANDTPDQLCAEFHGGYESNLNRHRLTTAFEIVVSGERGAAPAERQIHIAELSLRHDASAGKVYLYCERLGKRVIPVYAGMFYPLALPSLQAFLLHFASPTMLRSDLMPKFAHAENDVSYCPRVRYKSVIIERARWTCGIGCVPARLTRESDFAFCLRLAKWRTEVGIPRRCFVRLVVNASVAAEAEEDRPLLGGGEGETAVRQKPFYVDFENLMSIGVLERQFAKRSGYVHFTEMLPSSDAAAVVCDGEKHVSEFVCEMTQRWHGP